MATTVSLRLRTSETSHDEAREMFPESRIDSSWRVGDTDFRGRKHESFGMNVFVTEEDAWGAAVSNTVRMVSALPKAFSRLGELGVVCELDFGIETDSAALERSATLTSEVMEVFSRAGVAVRVSFYSVEDEE